MITLSSAGRAPASVRKSRTRQMGVQLRVRVFILLLCIEWPAANLHVVGHGTEILSFYICDMCPAHDGTW